MNKTLTIVIPAYNESKRISYTLVNIDEYISKNLKFESIKVIIVNDGSLDNTSCIVTSWIKNESKNKKCFELIEYSQNKGKGYAVKTGFLHASSDLVIFTDADGASPIKEIEKLLYWVENNYDIVCGSKYINNKEVGIKRKFARKFSGYCFQIFLLLLGMAVVKDTQCGFKLFKLPVAKKLATNQKCHGFSFDVEYLYLAKKYEYKIKEVAVSSINKKGSTIRFLIDPIKIIIDVLKIKFFYKYN